jgi:two-component system cell cycle response regulator DivK
MTTKILVADDDFDNRTIVLEVLSAAGYDVVLAVNGQEALEQTILLKPEVLILDLSMPKMNGWEVARRVREMPELSGTVIVAFTAHALVGDELKAKAAGCDDYLSKPCLPKEVVKKVAFWLEHKRKTEPKTMNA